MEEINEEETLESINIVRESTLNKQLRQIYLDQERRRKVQENKRKFLDKWGYVFSCCLI